MKVYKLTDPKHKTYNNTKWGKNITHEISKIDVSKGLCTAFWLHAYENPYVAVLLNPEHANIKNPVLWEAEAEGEIKKEWQMKLGCTKLTTIRKIPLPNITLEQKIEIGIRCALVVSNDTDFKKWALSWLDGTDRSKNAARATAWAVESRADTAAYVAYAAAFADYAESHVAYATACAVIHANRNGDLDLIKIINDVINKK